MEQTLKIWDEEEEKPKDKLQLQQELKKTSFFSQKQNIWEIKKKSDYFLQKLEGCNFSKQNSNTCTPFYDREITFKIQ